MPDWTSNTSFRSPLPTFIYLRPENDALCGERAYFGVAIAAFFTPYWMSTAQSDMHAHAHAHVQAL